MANQVWTWFKKLGHWISVGTADINKFVLAAQQSGVLTLLGPAGGVINAGIGVFEKIVAANTKVETVAATLGSGALSSTQKLAMATPDALQALYAYADAIGMKISAGKQAQVGTIAAGIASFGADFLNTLEPMAGDKLPTPNVPTVAPIPSVPLVASAVAPKTP
jgi:hypothetical protein